MSRKEKKALALMLAGSAMAVVYCITGSYFCLWACGALFVWGVLSL